MLLRYIAASFFILIGSASVFAAALDPVTDGDKIDISTIIQPQKPVEPENAVEYNVVVLQGLNKVTGHISKLEGPLGTVMRFGNLEVIARRCWKAPPEERPENAALIEIRELKPEEQPQKIFLGWMFSSSPGLSGLEHPVYDVNVLSCEFDGDPEKNGDAAKKPDEPAKPDASDKKATHAKKKHAKKVATP